MVKHYIMNFLNYISACIQHKLAMYSIKNGVFTCNVMDGPYNRVENYKVLYGIEESSYYER